jgi:hypothetical protein
VLYCLFLNSNFVSETRPIMQYISTISLYPLLSKTSEGSSSTEFDISTLHLRCGAASLHNWNLKKIMNISTFQCELTALSLNIGTSSPNKGMLHPIGGSPIRQSCISTTALLQVTCLTAPNTDNIKSDVKVYKLAELHTHTHIYIYIYIYICVCVCVCYIYIYIYI